jgi:hypothetical protein
MGSLCEIYTFDEIIKIKIIHVSLTSLHHKLRHSCLHKPVPKGEISRLSKQLPRRVVIAGTTLFATN